MPGQKISLPGSIYASFVSLPLYLIPAIFCVASKTQNYISQAPFQVASLKVQPVRVIGRRTHTSLPTLPWVASLPQCFPLCWELPFLRPSIFREVAATANLWLAYSHPSDSSPTPASEKPVPLCFNTLYGFFLFG